MKILAFGEILWDIFPQEKKIGGAPFNFAAHCHKLGADSYLISSVGADDNGKEALKEITSMGIKPDFISVNRSYPTGYCNIELKDGIPQYSLGSNVAFDHIPSPAVERYYDALYMGTLALRGIQSRRSFERVLKSAKYGEILFDVNFRGNFYSRELVNQLMRDTTILKISHEEVYFFGKKGNIDTCLELSKKYPKLKYICLTLGKDGAMVYDCKNRNILFSDVPKSQVVSTVGAGDSFASCFLVSLLEGYPVEECLDRAVILSDYVVTQLGAVPEYDKNRLFNIF